MVMTTWAPSTASAADAATRAPACFSGSVASRDRSHTVVRSPAPMRLRAIAEPMMPVPSTVTSALLLMVLTSLGPGPAVTSL